MRCDTHRWQWPGCPSLGMPDCGMKVSWMHWRSQGQVRDSDLRWRVPLEEKQRIIQQAILDRHLVEGTCVASVPIPADGRPVDHTTTGNTGDMHASSWTGCYLVAAAFRYGWAAERSPVDVDAALKLGETLVHGIDVLTHVSGIPGLLARKVVHGHGPAVEERIDNNSRNEWHQGVGRYRDLRFRGHPSHHNYHHVLRGLGFWFFFLRKHSLDPSERVKAQMEKVRSIVAEMMEFGYKAHDMALMTVDGRLSAHLIAGAPEGQPSTTSLMATNSLRIAHWITGDNWYKEKYEELVERFGYRKSECWPPDRWQPGYRGAHTPDHDDTEHTLASLWLVCQLEEDRELCDFYRMAVASIFGSKRYEKRSPFNYYYASVTGDLDGADLPGALETLRLYPSVTVTYPIMNSIRSDIGADRAYVTTEDGSRNSKTLLPFNEQPLDNAYDWKGDPYVLDGWLARPVSSMAISDEDPMVWYLVDAGGVLYKSLDGGATFSLAGFHQGASVRDVTFAGGKSRIAILATDGGIYRTDTGGYMNSWQRVDLDDQGAQRVMPDSANPNVVWAIMDGGVYRSVDFGFEEVGKAWECVSGPMPNRAKAVPGQTANIVYGLFTGDDPVIYAAMGGRLYRKSPGDSGWTICTDVEDYHVIPSYRGLCVSPHDPAVLLSLLTLNVWGRDLHIVLRSLDGGRSVRAVGWSMPRYKPPSEGSGLEWSRLASIAFDPVDPNVLYGAGEKGIHRSLDGGLNWQVANNGLRIPYAYRIFAPRQIPGTILASTPAGLHVSTDRGETWGDPILVLNGPGVDRVERGGMGYLAAYWPGRYFGYITDDQANSAPETW